MSKINELIKKLCPNGVRYYQLSELEENGKIVLGRGNVISKKDIIDNPGSYPVYSSSAVGNGEIGRYGKYMFDDIRISWSIDGGGRFFYRNAPKYSITNVSGWLKVQDILLIDTKYLYYILTNEWTKKTYDYNHKAHPSVIKKEYRIPIPPMEIQKEIVRIFDEFEDLTVNGLEKLLTTELEERIKQYDYYLNKSFNSVKGQSVKLGSIVNFSRGKRVVKKDLETYFSDNLYPVYQNSMTPLGYYGDYNFENNKTIIISAGAAGEIGFVNDKIWAADDCLKCSCTSSILDKYLYYFLKSNDSYIKSMVRRASVPRISISVFEKMDIILPTIEEQKRIISLFDKFENLIRNVKDIIPAEIELRRKQYEYYRNKLLNFEELSVSE